MSLLRFHRFTRVYNRRLGLLFSKRNLFWPSASVRLPASEEAIRHTALVAFQKYGFLYADVNPLAPSTLSNLDRGKHVLKYGEYPADLIPDEDITYLSNAYCQAIGAEFDHCYTNREKFWLAEKIESLSDDTINNSQRIKFAKLMLQAEALDQFIGAKFPSVKRYSCEGAETAMVFYDQLFEHATHLDVSDIVMCLAHRGRLNLLSCLLKYPPEALFHKMSGGSEIADDLRASGDVLSHLFTSVDLSYSSSEKSVHVSLLPNPSHLEACNPVAAGKTRARQYDYSQPAEPSLVHPLTARDKVVCLQVHGDAAISAQGVVAETFVLEKVPKFEIGGTVHLIINNQLGFTTPSNWGRSSLFASDIAKMNGCPVFHVNADYPEDVAKVAKLAMDYRQEFHRDVIVDLICFRRWGHNELDEPALTQPLMYKVIRSRKSIPQAYAESLFKSDICRESDLSIKKYSSAMKRATDYKPEPWDLRGKWSQMTRPDPSIACWQTGLPIDLLRFIGSKSVSYPTSGFSIHPSLVSHHVEKRLKSLKKGEHLDWATAESLAVGSLLCQGVHVRLSGQDVGRGTFSHRHWTLVDQNSEDIYVPLNNISDNQAFLEVAPSPLSELAVLGFEYGYSLENPNALVIWEAQFGDFFNTAQTVFDTFIASAESKWLLQSGIVVLLPHGMDGAGPEHSSCRIERFLQLSDSSETECDGETTNISVVNPTTPAQYFHLLRRQVVRSWRKPLIVASPKAILRLSAASSSILDFSTGTHFRPVLDDPAFSTPGTSTFPDVNRLIFCSGKHYYTLEKHRSENKINDVAIIRIEELSPFPAPDILAFIRKYPNAKHTVWSQEEHRNAGPWFFVSPRFRNLLGVELEYCGRDVLATPAVGLSKLHKKETADILSFTFDS